MNVLNWVVKLVPLMISGIQAVEGLFSKGTDKKTAVVNSTMSIVSILVATGVITQDQANSAPEAVGELNDAFVKFMNVFGLLNGTATSAATTTAVTSK